MSAPRWQDVFDGLLGSETLAPTHESEPVHVRQYPEKAKNDEDHHSDPYAVTKIGLAMACGVVIFVVLQIISIKTTPHELTPCVEMMERLIKDLPARCLFELSGVSPR